jgi:aryl-phospho-beta-D-glucosidase BglC (GH1 family)
MKRREFLASALAAAIIGGRPSLATPESDHWRKLPRWRGFNLLEKFYRNQRFRETDFQWISDWGFDFVRLPMDYRQWTDPSDPCLQREEVLEHIDEAIEFGRKHGVHVSLNLHNAPGFSVNAAVKHPFSLWHDEEPQRQFAFHWKQFARRYRGISSARLSFNLVNEPAQVDEATYVAAVRGAIDAIRATDEERLIISDGLNWGRDPIWSMKPLRIAQSTRGYDPMEITHYRASWVDGAGQYPVPVWPVPQINGRLYGSSRPEWQASMIIEGPFASDMGLRVRVGQVSSHSRLVVKADGNTILDRTFRPGPGEGDWKQVIHSRQWNVYQNIYDRDYTARVPAGTKRVELRNGEGDWMIVTELGLSPSEGSSEQVIVARSSPWGQPQEGVIRYKPGGVGPALVPPSMLDRQWLAKNRLAPWKSLAAEGVGVHVGEWGAHRFTPHDVVLRWAEDLLALWREAGFGWALWNLRGSFGIVDSQRDDVDYVGFHGHSLDRKFLDLLRAH